MRHPVLGSGFGVACADCGDTVIAPYWSQFVCKHEVRHFWICESCGQPFRYNRELAHHSNGKRRKSAGTEYLSAVA